MMELYANWRRHYRTPEEMLGFLEAIAPERYQVHLSNEYFDTPPLGRGVIGFLMVYKAG